MVYPPSARLVPGTLWSRIQQQTDHALGCGALQPIDTRYEFVEQGGMRFLVRILANLVRKEKADLAQQAQQREGKPFNPFLPYDPDLFVADLSDTHLVLLNKYNVVDHHILIITRAFEDQDSWLTPTDFAALALGMAEIDGLAFYNGGRLAGASQRHKHLQLVPPPLCPDSSPLPLAAVLDQDFPWGQNLAQKAGAAAIAAPVQSPTLPFRHGVLPLNGNPDGPTLFATYRALLASLGVDWAAPAPLPYNLLVTRQWMLAVARQQDSYASIPVNSLGFAGSLLVKNLDQFDRLKAIGPMTVLKQVACSG